MLGRFLGAVLSMSIVLCADTVFGGSSKLELAVKAYDDDEINIAIDTYKQMIDDEGLINGHLLYNLGNAFYRDGQVGQAMAAYLGARFFIPRDPDLRANLAFVGEKTQDRLQTSRASSWEQVIGFWLQTMTANEMWWFTAIILTIGLLWLALCNFLPLFAEWTIAGWLVVGLGSAFGAASSLSQYSQRHWGAVTTEMAQVLSGPGEHNTILFELKEGAPFMVQKRQQAWYLIELSDGKRGWLESAQGTCYTWPKFL